MLKPHDAGRVEENVDDGALGGGEQHLVDEGLAARSGRCRRRRASCGAPGSATLKMRVFAVFTRYRRTTSLAPPRPRTQVSPLISMTFPNLPMAMKFGPGRAERCDVSVLDEQVVQGDRQLAVDRRPVRGIGGLDDDRAVETHLQAEVLADVRVVPVEPGIGELDLVGERLHRSRWVLASRAGPRRSGSPSRRPCQCTVASTSPSLVTSHGDLGALVDVQRRARDRAVVGEHAQIGVVRGACGLGRCGARNDRRPSVVRPLDSTTRQGPPSRS